MVTNSQPMENLVEGLTNSPGNLKLDHIGNMRPPFGQGGGGEGERIGHGGIRKVDIVAKKPPPPDFVFDEIHGYSGTSTNTTTTTNNNNNNNNNSGDGDGSPLARKNRDGIYQWRKGPPKLEKVTKEKKEYMNSAFPFNSYYRRLHKVQQLGVGGVEGGGGGPQRFFDYESTYMLETRYVWRDHFSDVDWSEKLKKATATGWMAIQSTGLRQIPADVFKITEIQQLYITSNKISGELPREFAHLYNLRKLDMFDNRITDFPSSLCLYMSSLEHLSLCHNRLTKIPKEFQLMSALVNLDLSHNQITTVPEAFGLLINLKTLNLSFNKIRELSGNIFKGVKDLESKEFQGILNLRVLDLSNNSLREIPSEIGFLRKLKDLDVRNNNIQEIPESIVKIKALKYFQRAGNPAIEKQKLSLLGRKNPHIQSVQEPMNGQFPFGEYTGPSELELYDDFLKAKQEYGKGSELFEFNCNSSMLEENGRDEEKDEDLDMTTGIDVDQYLSNFLDSDNDTKDEKGPFEGLLESQSDQAAVGQTPTKHASKKKVSKKKESKDKGKGTTIEHGKSVTTRKATPGASLMAKSGTATTSKSKTKKMTPTTIRESSKPINSTAQSTKQNVAKKKLTTRPSSSGKSSLSAKKADIPTAIPREESPAVVLSEELKEDDDTEQESNPTESEDEGDEQIDISQYFDEDEF
eukprot:Nk52_evm31s250 gene=Nk52_evmTU31s250